MAKRVGTLMAAFLAIAAAGTGQQAPQFRADVNRVRVDVIVTDEDGNFVDDLGPDDFVLTEDGVPQPIVSIQLVDLARGRVVTLRDTGSEQGSGATDTDLASTAERGDRPTGTDPTIAEAAADQLGQLIMLIDLVGLDVRTKARFSATFEHWLEDEESLNLPWAIYLLDNESRLYELAPLGSDIEALRGAIGWFRDFRWTSRAPIEQMLNDDLVRAAALEELAGSGPDVAAPRFAAHLADGRGRTALVWVTGRRTRTFLGREVFRAANSANVSLYVLNPVLRPLGRAFGTSAADTFQSGQLLNSEFMMGRLETLNLVSSARRARARDTAVALSALAEETGGYHFDQWTDLDESLATIKRETSLYYLLTYTSPPPDADGRYHEIGLTVSRPGVSVKARRGYVDYSPAQRRNRLANAFRTLPTAGGTLSVASDAFLTWTPAGVPAVVVATAIDPAELGGASANATETPQSSFAVRATAFDQNGDVAAEMVDLVEAPSAVGSEPETRKRILHRSVWRPDAAHRGRLAVEIVVVDQVSNRNGRVRTSVEVPDVQPGGWYASTPMLVEANGREPLVPVAGGRSEAGKQTGIFIQILGGTSPVLSGAILAGAENTDPLRIGKAAGIRLPPTPLTVSGATHQGVLWIPATLEPGDYIVEITIADEPANEWLSARVPLHVTSRR